MTIEEKIKKIADDYFSEYPYIFDNVYRIDERIHQNGLPCILAIIPTRGRMTIRNGRVHDVLEIQIGFFDKIPHDANGDDNAECYNRMKDLAFSFIKKCNESHFFMAIESVDYTLQYAEMADILTGVLVSMRVEDLGRC